MHGGSKTATQFAIDFRGEALQIDVRGIDEREQLGKRSIAHLAVRNEHVDKPARMNSL